MGEARARWTPDGRSRAASTQVESDTEVEAETETAVEVGPRRSDGVRWVLARYAASGALTQVVYLSLIALALAAGVHYMAAIVIAQAICLCFVFPLYRRRVFRSTGPVLRQFVTFLGVWSVGAAMSLVGVPLLVELVGMPPFVAQLVVLVVIFLFSFLSHHRVTFRQR